MCTSQVVTTFAAVVKELVENALDANATAIVITLDDHGFTSIKVADNGDGIPCSYIPLLCLPSHTSKISSFDDIASVVSYGFRGEALSALAALGNVDVTTQYACESGVHIWYGSSGCVSRQITVPRQRGTTVNVANLFSGIPVRKTLLLQNKKREFSKCVDIATAYAVLLPVAFTLIHNNGKK